MPHTREDPAHLGAEVLAAVLRHRPTDASPAVIAAWIDERLERATKVEVQCRGVEVVDVAGWLVVVGGAAN